MRDPNKEDKRKQDLMMKKVKRSPATEAERHVMKNDMQKKARRDAVVNMRDKGMEDVIKSLSLSAVKAEQSGNDAEAERLTKKIEKLKLQLANEQKSSSFED